jgi:nitrate reductase NapE component
VFRVGNEAEELSQKPTRRRRGNEGAWIAREYGMFVFLRLVIILSVSWAVVGSFFYKYLLDYLGWNRMSLEIKWSLFIGLTLLVAAIAAAFFIGAYQLVLRICRSFQRGN